MFSKINHSDVNNWKYHPVTQHLFALIEELDTQYTQILKDGIPLQHSDGLERYARVVGFLDALKVIKEAELSHQEETKDNE